MKRLIFIIALMLLPSCGWGATYYIDYVGGDNTNNGTSTSTPWKSHPKMQSAVGCGGTLPSYSHVAGDQFIFKGGVTWPNACFQMQINVAGTVGSRDYYGVDKTWYTGGVWTRPIFDLENTASTGGNPVNFTSAADYLDFDNVEIKRFRIVSGTFKAAVYGVTGSQYVTIKNCYIHDWSTADVDDSTNNGGIIWNGGEVGTIAEYNIIEGEATGATNTGVGVGIRGIETIRFNNISHATDGIISSTSIYNNIIHDMPGSFDASQHEDALTIYGSTGTTKYVYNNTFYNIVNAGLVMEIVPGWTGADGIIYVYNNLSYNNSPRAINVDPSGSIVSTVTSTYIYNNTLDCGGGMCLDVTDRAYDITNLYIQNNHWITDVADPTCIASGSCGPVTGTLVESYNLLMTQATAISQGYIESTLFQHPQGGSAINAGTDLSGTFTTDINGTTRPQGASWDIGAYEYETPIGTHSHRSLLRRLFR